MKIRGLGNLIGPIPSDDWVLNFGEKFLHEFLISHDANNLDESTTGLRHDRKHRVSYRMFKPWSDDAGALRIVEFVHEVDDCTCYEMFLFLGLCLEKI